MAGGNEDERSDALHKLTHQGDSGQNLQDTNADRKGKNERMVELMSVKPPS